MQISSDITNSVDNLSTTILNCAKAVFERKIIKHKKHKVDVSLITHDGLIKTAMQRYVSSIKRETNL